MSAPDTTAATVRVLEALILEKFKTEPFQNLHMLRGTVPSSPAHGGTCSEKTLSFLRTARRGGFNASLHSGFIGGNEIHRLARVQIDGQTFFADVGNGWPALKLYPALMEIDYNYFGMGFRTEIHRHRLVVFHRRNGMESRQLEIDFRPRPESEIMADIASRLDQGTEYPFSNSRRFALIVEDRFLFLRGERLEIYSDCGNDVIEGIAAGQVPSILREYFHFDYDLLFGQSSPESPERSEQ